MRIYIIVAGVFLAIAFACFLMIYWQAYSEDDDVFVVNSTDHEIETHFIRHKADFELMREMFNVDGFSGDIWKDEVTSHVKNEISDKRINRYQKIIKDLKLFKVYGDALHFEAVLISDGDITTQGCLKGYVYFKQQPEVLSDVLPKCYGLNDMDDRTAYKNIGNNWYMFVYYAQ